MGDWGVIPYISVTVLKNHVMWYDEDNLTLDGPCKQCLIVNRVRMKRFKNVVQSFYTILSRRLWIYLEEHNRVPWKHAPRITAGTDYEEVEDLFWSGLQHEAEKSVYEWLQKRWVKKLLKKPVEVSEGGNHFASSCNWYAAPRLRETPIQLFAVRS